MGVADCIDTSIVKPKVGHASYRAGTAIQKNVLTPRLKKISAVPPLGNGNEHTGAEDGEFHSERI